MPIVMQVIPSLDYGGVEQGVIDINAGLIAAGWQSVVVSNGGRRIQEVLHAGGKHISLPVHSKNPLTMASNAGRLRQIIREQNVDVVHACSRAPAWSSLRAVAGTRARYVTSCHSAHAFSNFAKRFYNSSVCRGELVIAVSQFLADGLVRDYGADADKIRVVHRGVSLEKYDPSAVASEKITEMRRLLEIPEGMRMVLLPGRLTRSKGHFFLLDALEKLHRKDAFCVFLGSLEPGYAGELEQYIAGKGLQGRVRMQSAVGDMPAAYLAADVVAAPSITPEGFGRISIEAQAMGRPVIATRHGGAMETIRHGETGWLVTPGNVDELAAALNAAFSLDENARAVLAKNAIKHVADNFTNDLMCRKTIAVYAEVLGNAGTARRAA
ncbi:MAG: glycosyltransferase [Alphaproteobacteria bacterium]|nr:MAG: glycosyltransferase [Alphaproteobacteria bacterium]